MAEGYSVFKDGKFRREKFSRFTNIFSNIQINPDAFSTNPSFIVIISLPNLHFGIFRTINFSVYAFELEINYIV